MAKLRKGRKMPKENNTENGPSIEIDGTLFPLIDLERRSILAEALGEEKLLPLFAAAHQSITESAVELRENWRIDDAHLAGRSAHRLIGVSANFGLSALAAIHRKIKRDCQTGGDGKSFSTQFEDIARLSLEILEKDRR